MSITEDRASIYEIVSTLVAAAIEGSQQVRFEAGTYEGVTTSGDGMVRLDSVNPDLADPAYCTIIGPQPNRGARVVVAHVPPMAGYILGEVMLPAVVGQLQPKVLLNSPNGRIEFYDSQGVLIGQLTPTEWTVGKDGSAITRLDPIGGVRLRDDQDVLRAQLSPYEGLTLRQATSGITGATLRDDGLIVIDPPTGDTISITSGNLSTLPTPKWAGQQFALSGSTPVHGTPGVDNFGTGDDFEIRYVSAAAWGDTGAQSWTPPAGFTERSDVNGASTWGSLSTTLATRRPAAANTQVSELFDPTFDTYWRHNGHSVVIRGGSAAGSPQFRAITNEVVVQTDVTPIVLTIPYPPGVAAGDILLAFVSIMSGNIPVGWSVPAGWVQLGVVAAGIGTPYTLSSGVWYKQATASEPTSAQVTVNMSAAGITKVHVTAIVVQRPYSFPAGLDIRRNNRSMPRGLIAESVGDTNFGTFAHSALPQWAHTITGVPVLAGRSYRLSFNCPIYMMSALAADCAFTCAIELDTGGGYGWWRRTIRQGIAGVSQNEIFINGIYKPAANGTISTRISLYNALTSAGYNIVLYGGAGYERLLSVEDVGAVY